VEQSILPSPFPTEPLVSVLVPVLNAARFLPEALASIAAQTYTRLEIIVIDGLSTDATAQIAQSLASVRYLRQTGVNMFNALNEGLDAATGEYVAILSSDDVWTCDKLQLQVEYLTSHPETDLVFGLTKHVLVEGQMPPGFRPELLQGERAASYLEAMLARASTFERVGKFNQTLNQAADTDWFARFRHLNLRSEFIPHRVVTRRMHSSNLSHIHGGNLYHELLVATRAQTLRHRSAGGSR